MASFHENHRSSILSKLESQGILTKLRSEIRFHVFNELDNENGSQIDDQTASQTVNLSVQSEGVYLLDVVREYLQFHGLLRSLSMLEAEAASSLTQSSAQSNNQSTQIRPIDRSVIASKLNMSESLTQGHAINQANKPRRSLLHSLQIQSQSSRPPSPLISPRSLKGAQAPLSEDRPIPMLEGIDFTPPDSPPKRSQIISNYQMHKMKGSTPPRIISSPGKSPAKSPPAERASFNPSHNQSRLHDLSQKLSHLRPDDIQRQRDQMSYDDQPSNSIDTSNLPNLQIVRNRDSWASRYDHVEIAQRPG